MERYRDSLKINILLTFIFGLLCAAEAPKYKLTCLNDNVVTIRCVLNISIDRPQEGNGSYWLEFEDKSHFNIKKFACPLVNQMDRYCCTVNSTERFIDTEYFVITLCENGVKLCKEMDKSYKPVHHIKPNAPININVNWSSGHYWFTWDSGYESYKPKTFMKRLKYRLQYYKHGHPDSAITIHPGNKTQHIHGSNFEPGVEYIAKVCSSPGQVHYKGYWSEWSTAVKWRTHPSQVLDATPSTTAVLLFIGSFSFLACVLVFLYRCRIKFYSSVPSPAPYFQPIYSNYNGNFQSWLVSQSYLREPFAMEETLKIENLIEATPIVNEERFLPLPSSNQHVNVCGMVNQDNVDTPPSTSIQKSSFEVIHSQSLEQMGTSGDDFGCEGLVHSPASSWLPGAGSSLEPQSMCRSKDYCILTDTNKDRILLTGME